jgi:hypothetical protein
VGTHLLRKRSLLQVSGFPMPSKSNKEFTAIPIIGTEKNTSTVQPLGDAVILVAIVAVLGTILTAGIKSFLSHKNKVSKNR